MIDNVGRVLVFNGELKNSDEFNDDDLKDKKLIYEVIRIIKKVPLYFEDHYMRMAESAKSTGIKLNFTIEEIRNGIDRLVKENNEENCNVKLILYKDDRLLNCLIHINKSYYPGEEEFEKGVNVSLFKWVRENPNAKIVNNTYKDAVSKKIKEDNVFELLLINGDDKITEGSKSNVFFVKDNKVFTAGEEYILKGITRQYVISACKNIGVEVIEELVPVMDLKDIDGLFLSGTSIKVLPVSKVDDMDFESGSNSVIKSIGNEFNRLIDEYIESNK